MISLPLHRWLYAVCVLTDFSAFLVVFAVSRGLAERGVAPWYLGLVGAGLSFCAGVGSILGGWLAHRWSSRGVLATYINQRMPYALAAVALLGLVAVQAWVRRRANSPSP